MPCDSFPYGFRVPLHEIDAGGVMFFAHLFRHAHDAYEDFMAAIAQPLDRLIRDGPTLLPLVHAEADYRAPMRHGQTVTVHLCVAEVGVRSFTLSYRFTDESGRVLALARTVHAHAGPGRSSGAPLPAALAAALGRWRCRD
jgi:1,4-dihydroxy-2-naphthoyl-CoA hydrolase